MLDSDLTSMDSEDFKSALLSLVEELIEDQCIGLAFEIHRACKTGSFLIADTDPESAQNYALVNKTGHDVLGQTPTKKNFECQCPHCSRPLAALRFAPHLEKCMGMGRNSSRIASRRIASNTKRDSEDSGGDDENDNDWSYGTENKKVKKIKKEKGVNSPRNKKANRLKNGVSHASSNGPHSSHEYGESVSETPNYDNMTIEDRKALLLNSCGVISEHTKKMCTRTLKCPQHSDEQRRQVRHLLLRQNRQQQAAASEREDTLVDIDTCDDTETQSLRESLQWEASSNSSPADSTSTNNKRRRKIKVENRRSYKKSGTTSSHKRPVKSSKHSTSSSSKSKKQKLSSKPSSSSSSKDSASTSLYDFPS